MKLVDSPGILKYNAGTLPINWLMDARGIYKINNCVRLSSNSNGYNNIRVVKTPIPGTNPANKPPITPKKNRNISILYYTKICL
jgi:hypothetical protein